MILPSKFTSAEPSDLITSRVITTASKISFQALSDPEGKVLPLHTSPGTPSQRAGSIRLAGSGRRPTSSFGGGEGGLGTVLLLPDVMW